MEIKKDSDSNYTLCTSDEMNENTINIEVQTINETQIQEIKSSDIDKEKQIILNEDTLFQFDCEVDYDYLILKLSEIDALEII